MNYYVYCDEFRYLSNAFGSRQISINKHFNKCKLHTLAIISEPVTHEGPGHNETVHPKM